MIEIEERGCGGGRAFQVGRKMYRMLEGGEEGTGGRGPGPGTGYPRICYSVMSSNDSWGRASRIDKDDGNCQGAVETPMKKSYIAGLFREVQQAEKWSSVQARMSIPYQAVCPTAEGPCL